MDATTQKTDEGATGAVGVLVQTHHGSVAEMA